MSIVLHHLNASRSDSIFWVLEELELPYDVKVHWRTPEGRAPVTLKDVSPLGKAPVVSINGTPHTESGAIVHRLLTTYPHPPAAGLEREPGQDSVFWSHFAEGSLMLHLQATLTASKVTNAISSYRVLYFLPFFLRGVNTMNGILQKLGKENATAMLEEIEAWLAKNNNFSGVPEIGEGDFMMFFALNSVSSGSRKGLYEVGPRTLAWIERIKARPAWQRAQQRLQEEEAAQPPAPRAKH